MISFAANAFQWPGNPEIRQSRRGDIDSSNTWFAGPTVPTRVTPHPKRNLDRFSRFCTVHQCDQHTDTQTTTLRATYVEIRRSSYTVYATRPNNVAIVHSCYSTLRHAACTSHQGCEVGVGVPQKMRTRHQLRVIQRR